MTINILIAGQKMELTREQAKELWEQLDSLFGTRPVFEVNPPFRQVTQPWIPMPDPGTFPDPGPFPPFRKDVFVKS